MGSFLKEIRKRVEYILKHNRVIQFLYRHIMSGVFRFVGVFIKTDNKLVLLNSFGGRKFNDSPRVLFERMKEDDRFKNYKFVWAFEHPEKFDISGAESITIDSWRYFVTALRAKVWISSVNIERGLHFKKKNTIYVNTWHGAGTKLIGNACNGRKDYNFSSVDIMLVQSEFERKIFERDFLCKPTSIRKIGFPRNDELFNLDESLREEIRHTLRIPDGKKVILYAPTWRDSKDGGLTYEFEPPIHIEKWKERLSDDYVMLFRMHAFTTKFVMEYDEFARDCSTYENLNHILAITSIVITDYSTIVYDCAIARIPFICFGYDYITYKKERGFYYDLDDVYPGGVFESEDAVLKQIKELEKKKLDEQYLQFREKYIEVGGSATDCILNELSNLLE